MGFNNNWEVCTIGPQEAICVKMQFPESIQEDLGGIFDCWDCKFAEDTLYGQCITGHVACMTWKPAGLLEVWVPRNVITSKTSCFWYWLFGNVPCRRERILWIQGFQRMHKEFLRFILGFLGFGGSLGFTFCAHSVGPWVIQVLLDPLVLQVQWVLWVPWVLWALLVRLLRSQGCLFKRWDCFAHTYFAEMRECFKFTLSNENAIN